MKNYFDDIGYISNLNKTQLSKLVTRLSRKANARLKTLEKNNIQTPATRTAMKSGGRFGSKGKNLNQLRAEYKRVSAYLNSETSTLRGWKKVRTKTIKTLKQKGIEVSPSQFEAFWTTYEKLKELHPELSVRQFKYLLLEEIAEEIENSPSISDAIDNLERKLSKIYENYMEINNEFESISQFFELPF